MIIKKNRTCYLNSVILCDDMEFLFVLKMFKNKTANKEYKILVEEMQIL